MSAYRYLCSIFNQREEKPISLPMESMGRLWVPDKTSMSYYTGKANLPTAIKHQQLL